MNNNNPIAIVVSERSVVVTYDAAGNPMLPHTSDVMACFSAMPHAMTVNTAVGQTDAVSVERWEDTPEFHAVELRSLFSLMPDTMFSAACKAKQLLYWDAHSHFCPCCGTAVEPLAEAAKKCPKCAFELYPVIAPAVIVRIERGDEILMVRAHNFRGDHYGLVAGFLEIGESLEECVRREVREETGLEIDDISYFGNQSWPFPSGVMIGFTARYISGEIKIQTEELADARFFGRDNLPILPNPMSIARRLVDDWLEK